MPLWISPVEFDINLRPGGAFRGPAVVSRIRDLRTKAQKDAAQPGWCLTSHPVQPSLDSISLGLNPAALISPAASAILGTSAARVGPAIFEKLMENQECLLPNEHGRLVDSLTSDLPQFNIDLQVTMAMPGFAFVKARLKAWLASLPLLLRRKMLWVTLTRHFQIEPTRQNAIDWLELDLDPLRKDTTATDDFSGDGNLNGRTASGGGTWTEQEGTGWSTTGGVARLALGLAVNNSAYNSTVFATDHSSQMNLVTTGYSSFFGIGTAIRFTGSSADYYFGESQDGSSAKIFETNSGTSTQLSTASYTLGNGELLKFSGSGNSLDLIINGTSRTTASDATHGSNTLVGIYGYTFGSGNLDNDNWEGSDGIGVAIPIAAYHYNHHLGSMA